MSEISNGTSVVESTSKDHNGEEPDSAQSETPEKVTDATEANSDSVPCTSSKSNESKNDAAKANGVDFVLISDDEGDDGVEKNVANKASAVNGDCSPNGIESIESDVSDDIDVIEDDMEDDDSDDTPDDEVEITGVSMAHNEFGTVGGMDQLLRTLINQGWTEAEIMQQLRGMIAPYQRRQRLQNFSSIDDLVECIKRVDKIIIVSGAGISVSCGIPDFRSETGLYARLSREYPTLPSPTAMFDLHYFINDPKPFYTFAKEIWPGQFEPSPCHRFIKLLESRGKLLRNYTQNIDTLEQVAGIERVIQCHGSFATASCIYCRYQVPGDDIKDDVMAGKAPICPKCVERRRAEGEEAYANFAHSRYREIKKKLRRREKLSPSSSESSSSTEDKDKHPSGGPSVKPVPDHQTDATESTSEKTAKSKSPNHDVKADGAAAEETAKSSDEPIPNVTEPVVSTGEKTSDTEKVIDGGGDGDKKSSGDHEISGEKQSESSSSGPSQNVETPESSKEKPCGSQTKNVCLDPLLKPDIVFFGEDLPRNFFDHAEEDLEQAELIIVIGSSMKVKPVASIPDFVQEQTPRVLINREPVRHISFDIELLGDADEIVQQLCHRLEWECPVEEASTEKKRHFRPDIVPLEELTPLPTRSEVEGSSSQQGETSELSRANSGGSLGTRNDKTNEKENSPRKGKDGLADKHEFEEPCPLFGSRCQCPISWNIARYLPNDAVVKMQPSTFIFPGANVMHPKHVYTAVSVTDSYTVDSDSDLGGYENPIEVSSGEGSEQADADDDEVHSLSDLGDDIEESIPKEAESSVGLEKKTSQDSDGNGSECEKIDETEHSSPVISDSGERCNSPSRSSEKTASKDIKETSLEESSNEHIVNANPSKRPSSSEAEISCSSKKPRLTELDSETGISTNVHSEKETSEAKTAEEATADDP